MESSNELRKGFHSQRVSVSEVPFSYKATRLERQIKQRFRRNIVQEH
jgi:hypothetical protein